MSVIDKAIEVAKAQIGDPYRYGGTGPNSFDCSGLVQYAYKAAGVTLPRTAAQQATYGKAVSINALQPGDLVFSNWIGRKNSHVSMYIGNGKMVVAPKTGSRVQIQTLDANYKAHVDGARRVVGGGSKDPDDDGGIKIPLPGLPFGVPLGGLVDAVKGIGTGVNAVAGSAASIGKVGEKLLALALPSNLMRMAAGFWGIVLVMFGLYFLAREVR